MPRNPFGWDLPPGCTHADIDRAFGDPDLRECQNCNEEFAPEGDERICKKCFKEQND